MLGIHGAPAAKHGSAEAPRPTRPLRADIQALRAIAVALVLLWHAEIPGLPGGFVGVDVFFVISGYLMVRLLVGELDRSGRLRVGRFLHRRARRLLPVALVVLTVTALASWWVLPVTALRSLGWDVMASATYVANWRFALTEVDYLAAEALPSPVQHYWSLSVEEQFYVILPLALLLVAVLLKRGRGHGSAALRVGAITLLALGVPSLMWSIAEAGSGDPGNYFSTTQRVWELCLGGGMALAALARSSRTVSRAVRSAAVLAGVLGILVSALLITPAAAYPGYLALAPTLSTALIIWADGDDLRLTTPAAHPWVQWLGDRSYSIYLWHWPLLLFADVRFEGSVVARMVAVAGSLALAAVTYSLIEERFRLHSSPAVAQARATTASAPRRVSSVVSVASLLSVTALTVLTGLGLTTERGDDSLTPDLATATDDRFLEFYDGDCRPKVSSSDPLTCSFGEADSETRILVVGDSHAVMWMPGIVKVGQDNGWRIDLQGKLSCPPVDGTVSLRGEPYTACRDWAQKVVKGIAADPPDLVILAMSPGYAITDPTPADGAQPGDALVGALGRLVQQIRAAGPPVVVMAVTPRFPEPVPDCLALHPDDTSPCQAHLPEALGQDWSGAVDGVPGASILDLQDELCPDGTCPTDADGILRWMDSHHLTATYVRTLAPQLEDHLAPLLE